MGEVLKFPPPTPDKAGHCRRHHWRATQDEGFAPPAGHRVTVYRCTRCGALKTVTRRE